MIIAICLLSLVLLCGILALAVTALAQEAAGAEFETGREFRSWDRQPHDLTDLAYDALVERSNRLALALA